MKFGYMFAGQGAQFAGMGAQLAEAHPAAAAIFRRADEVLGYSISDLCFNATLEQLTPCAVCQPTIFTVSVACFAAFTSYFYSEEPIAATGGLSLGEYSAAVAAGVLSFDDALKLVAERGRLMDKCCQEHPGGMTAVLGATPEQVADICEKSGIDVANYNCPGQIVISGTKDGLEKAGKMLEEAGLRAVALTVAGAYHSRLMKPAADEFAKALDGVSFNAPQCPFYQNVAGAAVSDAAEIKDNLRKQIYSSVRWESCARGMMEQSEKLIECGPGMVLSNFMHRISRNYPAEPSFAII